MKKRTPFRDFDPEQLLLLAPDLRAWLPEDHLAYYILDLVRELDLSAIERKYDGCAGGQPGYHPRLMVGLLLYAYCTGVPSSRKIEKATYESIPFRVLSADQHPDHDTVAEFRKRHLKELAALFVQVLQVCRRAGLVKLGHVALDGTKVRANASKHKAMSYARMQQAERELKDKVQQLLRRAKATDEEEDQRYGKGRRGDELPEELRFHRSRLAKIRQAKKALEEEARRGAEAQKGEYERKKEAWDNRSERRGGRPPVAPKAEPEAKAQRNFTDPDSRIMQDGATKSFEQCYNAQAAVDEHSQIIVAARVTQSPVDNRQLAPAVEKIKEHTGGALPKRLSADAGYWSEANARLLEREAIDGYLAPGKEKHTVEALPPPRGPIPRQATVTERMRRKLRTLKGRCTYCKRKHIVEPVFGQIKQVRGFRRFSFRGLQKVQAEWEFICLTHNLLKLFRSGMVPATA
jgi:transposase